MSGARSASILLSILFLAAHANAQDGRLSQVRQDVRTSTNSSGTSDTSANDDGSVLGDFLGSLFAGFLAAEDERGRSVGGQMLAYTLFAPYTIPAAVLEDDYKYHLYFAPHPYAGGYRGYQMLASDLAESLYDDDARNVRRKWWSGRLSVEEGNDFRGLNRFNGQMKVDHKSRFGFVTNWNWYREQLDCGCVDEAVIGDANLTFRFAQNEIASMYTGLGFRVLTDRRQTDWGFNVTYGGDWFPVRPLVVSGVFDAGTLGNTGVIHLRGSVGAIFHGWEVYAGYDFLQIGSTNLYGPMAGVRWWF